MAPIPGSTLIEIRPIAGKHLALEPQVAEHAGEMFVVLGDPAIYEHENQPPASAEWLRERFARLESRRSPDGEQLWLNWVVRLRAGGLIGYVQATVLPTGRAAIAYVLASKYWGRGLAAEACQAMIAELAERYGVRTVYAVFERRNVRSARLLERLGFAPALPESSGLEPDELLMLRALDAPE
jgi:[ribosomal protein S5]-alanine N-acetyltransferase